MENKKYSLGESEYRFAQLIWENEPIKSGDLVSLCESELGWKKSTTYTVLKKLCEKGIFKNENATVTVLIGKEKVQKYESECLVNGKFNGSLPQFIASFMGGKKITFEQAEQLKRLIDTYKEE